MQMLYDSDQYVVIHFVANAPMHISEEPPTLNRDGFEIVDKKECKGVYLDGAWADAFQKKIKAWQDNVPTQEEVEECLEGYAQLAQNPVNYQ